MLKRVFSTTLLSLTLASGAQAQTDLTVASFVPLGGRSVVSFNVTTAGTFDLWTTSILGPTGTTPFDPQLSLFQGLPTAGGYVGGTLVGSDDDGCGTFGYGSPGSQCGPAIFASNALLNNIALGVGQYTVVVQACCGPTEEAIRSGIGLQLNSFGDYNLRIASLAEFGGGTGIANVPGTVVPEPSTYMLMAAGLAGIGLVSRRRRQH